MSQLDNVCHLGCGVKCQWAAVKHCTGKLSRPAALVCRQAWWQLRAPAPGGLLICGPTGSGTTELAKLLGDVLTQHPDCLAHVVHVDCASVDQDTLHSAQHTLSAKVGRLPLMKHGCRFPASSVFHRAVSSILRC